MYWHKTLVVAKSYTGIIRSSHRKCSVRKCVFRNFAKFTGKHLCQSLFFNKLPGLRPATLLKKRLRNRCFPVNFAKFLIIPFLTKHLWRLFWIIWIFQTFTSCKSKLKSNLLAHFNPMSHFYTPWKRQKIIGFPMFSGGMEMWHWTKIG